MPIPAPHTPARRGRRRSRRLTRRLTGRLALVTLTAGVLLLVIAPAAQAHDVLISTNPADGSTVAVVPDQVEMTFNNAAFAVGTQILVNGPNGNIATGAVRIVNHDVVQAVASGSPAGAYTVLWRVTSADGHPVSGKFTFTATAASAKTAGASAAPAPVTPTKTSSGHGALWLIIAVAVVALWAGALLAIRARRRAAGAAESSG